MKKLIIVTNDNNGSARIKKDVYKHIKNFEVHFVSIKAKIPNFKNSVYIILKHISRIKKCVLKKIKKNNIVIFEPLDILHRLSPKDYFKNISKLCCRAHYVICNNKYHAQSLGSDLYAYHHSDNFKDVEKTDDVCYIGNSNKQSLTTEQFKIYSINTGSKMIGGIHIDFVLPNCVQYHIHTTTKLACAFNTFSIFICNKQPLYIELLGEDYELYINDDLSNIQEVIQKAKTIHKDEKLSAEYQNKYGYIRDQLSVSNCVQMYQKIVDTFL